MKTRRETKCPVCNDKMKKRRSYVRSQLDGFAIKELCSVEFFDFSQCRCRVENGFEIGRCQVGRPYEKFCRFTRSRRFQQELTGEHVDGWIGRRHELGLSEQLLRLVVTTRLHMRANGKKIK